MVRFLFSRSGFHVAYFPDGCRSRKESRPVRLLRWSSWAPERGRLGVTENRYLLSSSSPNGCCVEFEDQSPCERIARQLLKRWARTILPFRGVEKHKISSLYRYDNNAFRECVEKNGTETHFSAAPKAYERFPAGGINLWWHNFQIPMTVVNDSKWTTEEQRLVYQNGSEHWTVWRKSFRLCYVCGNKIY